MIERVLDALGAPAHAELVDERVELLRFGRSRLTYQHSEERVTLRARIARDGRSVWGTLGSADVVAVARLRERLERMAASLPPGDVAPLASPGETRSAETAFASTESADAAARVELFREAAESLPGGATVGGSVAHVTARHSVANSEGVVRAETRTRAAMQVVGAVDGRSSWARVVARDADEVGVPHFVPGLADLPPRPLEPGCYRAVLAPQAVVTLLATLGQIGFASGAPGSFEDRVGESPFDKAFDLVDDGCDAAGLPSTFDSEGVAKARVPLVEGGVIRGVVTRATGHGVPPGWRFGAGPSPSQLMLSAGDADDDALLAACGDGLYLQRVDYVRVVQPRQTLVTGSSRDATLWIAGGRVSARLPQFRFTLRLDELFASLVALGSRRERGETPFMESVTAPGAVVDAFPVDLVTA